MKTISTQTPAEIDAQLAELYEAESRLLLRRKIINDAINQAMHDERLGKSGYCRYTPLDSQEISAEIDELREKFKPLADEYLRRPWTRYYHVTNNNGHIHNSVDCSSCFATTAYSWRTDLSGMTEEEVVAAEAYNACSVCMPIAPAEQKEARKRYNAEQREARRLEKEAKANEKLRKQAERAVKFLAKVEKVVEKHYGGWDKLFAEYSMYGQGNDGKKSLYSTTFELQTTVGDYLMDEMRRHTGDRESYRKDPKVIVKHATEKGLI